MFKNIGNKIRVLTKIGFWLCFAAVLFVAVILFIFSMIDVNIFGFVISIVMIPVGFLVLWLASFIPYGVGELIQNTTDIRKLLIEQKNCKPVVPAAPAPVAPAPVAPAPIAEAPVAPAPVVEAPVVEAPVETPADAVTDKFLNLKKLKDAGLITEEEYLEKVKEL